MAEAVDSKKLDQVKDSLAASLRTLSEEKTLSIDYMPRNSSGTESYLSGSVARLPHPPKKLDSKDIAQLRGLSDTLALRQKYHDRGVYAAHRPQQETAAALFSALEKARYESLGVKDMPGIAENLYAAYLTKAEKKEYLPAETQDDVPLQEGLYLMALSSFTGKAMPGELQTITDIWTEYIDQHLGKKALQSLKDNTNDPTSFLKKAAKLVTLLEPNTKKREEENEEDESDTQEQKSKEQDNPDDQTAETQNSQTETQQSGTTPSQDQSQDNEKRESTTQIGESDNEDEDAEQAQVAQSIEDDLGEEDTHDADEASGSDTKSSEDGHIQGYRIFTDAFDEVVQAEKLATPAELKRLRTVLDQQLRPTQKLIGRLANRLQRKLLAKQQRRWQFNLEDGLLDTGRLAQIIADPNRPARYKQESETDFRDTVLTILIDNSGSMRGRPISIAAMSADILARTMERCGVKVEILGFTTRSWKGGRARQAWIEQDKPQNPGRLNELRHIIYKAADTPMRRAKNNLGLMLKEGVLKENIDGEALLWAHSRLIKRPEQRRIMMVISDGAPVDDATLAGNNPHYLEADLYNVINWIEARKAVELTAIGIGHDVTRYYSRAITLQDVTDLGETMIERLDGLFALDKKQR